MNNYKKVAENPQVFIDEIKAMHAALPKMMLHGKKVQVVLSDEVASMSMTLIDATIEELCENDIHNIAGAHAMLLLCISAISNGIAYSRYLRDLRSSKRSKPTRLELLIYAQDVRNFYNDVKRHKLRKNKEYFEAKEWAHSLPIQ